MPAPSAAAPAADRHATVTRPSRDRHATAVVAETDPVGPSPVIIHVDQLRRIVQPWYDFTLKIMKDPEAVHALGWVREMWGYCIAAAHLGIKHNVLDAFQFEGGSIGNRERRLAWPVPPTPVGPNRVDMPYYVFHYTYGIEYSAEGLPMELQVGEWSLDKRHYMGTAPPRMLEPPPACAHDRAHVLRALYNNASAAIAGWQGGGGQVGTFARLHLRDHPLWDVPLASKLIGTGPWLFRGAGRSVSYRLDRVYILTGGWLYSQKGHGRWGLVSGDGGWAQDRLVFHLCGNVIEVTASLLPQEWTLLGSDGKVSPKRRPSPPPPLCTSPRHTPSPISPISPISLPPARADGRHSLCLVGCAETVGGAGHEAFQRAPLARRGHGALQRPETRLDAAAEGGSARCARRAARRSGHLGAPRRDARAAPAHRALQRTARDIRRLLRDAHRWTGRVRREGAARHFAAAPLRGWVRRSLARVDRKAAREHLLRRLRRRDAAQVDPFRPFGVPSRHCDRGVHDVQVGVGRLRWARLRQGRATEDAVGHWSLGRASRGSRGEAAGDSGRVRRAAAPATLCVHPPGGGEQSWRLPTDLEVTRGEVELVSTVELPGVPRPP